MYVHIKNIDKIANEYPAQLWDVKKPSQNVPTRMRVGTVFDAFVSKLLFEVISNYNNAILFPINV